MANRHQQFIHESWRTLTGDTTEIEAIWTEVTGNAVMPEHEKGSALYMMGWWRWARKKTKPGDIHTPAEYRDYLIARFSDPDPPDVDPPTGPPFSNFLSHGSMTLQIPAYPMSEQRARIETVKARGYPDIDLYAVNINDNTYRERYWKVDASRNPDPVLNALTVSRQLGLRPTVWCFGDQLGGMSAKAAKSKLKRMIPVLDPFVTRYVYCLEMDESWNSDTNIEIYTELRSRTEKDCYIHWTRGINAGPSFPGVTGIYYQYEKHTVAGVQAETTAKIGKWHDAGKQFIAGEFPFDAIKNNPGFARELGEAVDDLVDGRASG